MSRTELLIAAKILLALAYALGLYMGPEVLQESFSIFDYGRF